VLERTAALDATLGRTLTVAQVRALVRDAGMSDASLRVALAELAVESRAFAVPPASLWRRVIDGSWRLTAVAAIAWVAMSALSSIGRTMRPHVGAPLGDAVTVIGIALGLGVGFHVARRLRSRLGQMLSAGFALAVLVDSVFGWSGFLVNGRSAKLAEMATAVVGVALGMWLSRRERSAPPAAPMASMDVPAAEEHAGVKRRSWVWFASRPRRLATPAL
jgi:hypothetical protein